MTRAGDGAPVITSDRAFPSCATGRADGSAPRRHHAHGRVSTPRLSFRRAASV